MIFDALQVSFARHEVIWNNARSKQIQQPRLAASGEALCEHTQGHSLAASIYKHISLSFRNITVA